MNFLTLDFVMPVAPQTRAPRPERPQNRDPGAGNWYWHWDWVDRDGHRHFVRRLASWLDCAPPPTPCGPCCVGVRVKLMSPSRNSSMSSQWSHLSSKQGKQTMAMQQQEEELLRLTVCLSVCLFVSLSISLCVCLSVCLPDTPGRSC